MYAGNNQTSEFNTTVTDLNGLKLNGQKISVDLEKKVWSYKLFDLEWNNVPIGKNRNPIPLKAVIHQEVRQGVIGVYDRTNTKHLDSLASAAIEATKYKNPSLVNDD